jgi:hypothetical protein
MPSTPDHLTIGTDPLGPLLDEMEQTGRVSQPEQTGADTPQGKRRYVISAEQFRCGDESGADWFGSDEVRWSFTTKRDDEEPVTNVSKRFGDVDSGDVREFGPGEGEIAPAEGSLESSVAAPVGVSIQLIEEDQGTGLEDTVEQAFEAAQFVPTVGQWVKETPEFVRNHLVEMLEDDLMGSNTIVFHPRNMKRRLPFVGNSFTDRLYFGGQGGDLPFAVAGGPDYFLYVRVTRVEDAE